MKRLPLLLSLTLLALPSFRADVQAESLPSAEPWLADLGDGRYRNPIVFADYSDPDTIRVGDDYWMTASSFSHVPGLPILHSRDLVNWRLVNHALPRLVPEVHFGTPRHGEGVWAPALRHHAGKFWIFYPDPDFGLYVITAEDPRGEWSAPRMIKAGRGLIDPCPLWDDQGEAWLVHGWAKSRAGINNQLTVHRMDPATGDVLGEGVVVIDANRMEGWRTLEGPKFYKRNGWYYIFAPAGGVAEGYQAVFRSRQPLGPYDVRIVLEQGGSPVNGPHQGAWVDTPSGENWFLHFQERLAYGRIVHLQPMDWRDDDWPAMGTKRDALGKGEPVLEWPKPNLPRQPLAAPATSDEFTAPKLGLQWQWQANPAADAFSLTETPGSLSLSCLPSQGKNHWDSTHLLLQKFPADRFQVSTEVQLQAAGAGDTAGLMVFGYDYAWLGLRATEKGTTLDYVVCREARQGGAEQVLFSELLPAGQDRVTLHVEMRADASCRFRARLADGREILLPQVFAAKSSRWVGGKVGVFAASPKEKSTGRAHFDYFRVTP